MLQKIRSSAAEIRRRIPGQQAAPTDAAFDRAKQQWISLEQSVQLLKAEVVNYKKEMKGIAHNGVQMMAKIVQMFEQPTATPQTSPTAAAGTAGAAGGGAAAGGPGGDNEWPDPNENHPYKDVAQLMKKTQERIQQEDIAVSNHITHTTPHSQHTRLARVTYPTLLAKRCLLSHLTCILLRLRSSVLFLSVRRASSGDSNGGQAERAAGEVQCTARSYQ